MKFEIDSSSITFSGKGFKTFFQTINAACDATQNSYFVVGAFARDIILENIFNQPTGIATQDIDVAIRINSWGHFNKFIDYLKSNHQFKDGENSHQFISPEGIITDIIPFGKIEENRKISFPPHEREINMLGFQEVHDSTIEIIFDNKIEIKIASIEGIAILKLIAWSDRQPERVSEKHTRDLGLIIGSYFHNKVSEFAKEFSDLFDEESFDEIICGARALGRRMKQIVSDSSQLEEQLNSIFKLILHDEENSLFLTQLSNAQNINYPFALEIIKNLKKGFQDF